MKKNNANKQGGNYEWFKNGSSGPKQKKTPKEHGKAAWKVIRILIYITLAALSLTGCVQSFVIGSGTYTGQGMELYTSEDDISPHVTTYQVDTKEGTVTLDTKANYWVSDKKELEAIHKKIKSDGGDIATWKTENNAVQIIVDGKVASFKKDGSIDTSSKHAITYVGTEPMVYSESSGTTKDAAGKNIIGLKALDIPLFKGDGNNAVFVNKFKIGAAKKPTKAEMDKWADDNDHRISESIFTFQNATFNILYQTLLEKTALFKDAAKLATKAATAKDKKLTTASDVAKIAKYQSTMSSLYQLTNVVPVKADGSLVDKDLKNAKEFNSFKNEKTGSSVGFNLSGKNRLRAIYNWDRAWVLGPFYGLFIYPLSRLTLAIVEGLPMMSGWETLIAIALVTIIIRTIAYLLSFKSTLQQVKQQELNAKKAAIEAKYEQYKGNKQMEQRKRQELSEMFKKEGVSPLGSIGTIFLTMPLFLAMWKIIGGIAHIKSTTWLSINFGQTSYKELFHGEWQYLPLMLTAAIIQGVSLYIPRLLTKRRDKNRINAHQKAALKKANKTQNIMMAVFVFMALIFSAGLQIYWIFGGLFTIGQNILNHHIIKWQSKRKKTKRIKVSK